MDDAVVDVIVIVEPYSVDVLILFAIINGNKIVLPIIEDPDIVEIYTELEGTIWPFDDVIITKLLDIGRSYCPRMYVSFEEPSR